jgi:hypothetical protein
MGIPQLQDFWQSPFRIYPYTLSPLSDHEFEKEKGLPNPLNGSPRIPGETQYLPEIHPSPRRRRRRTIIPRPPSNAAPGSGITVSTPVVSEKL